jgi:hypothetical protein
MKPSALDLRISLYAGPSSRFGAVILFGHIRAQDHGSPEHPLEFLVLCRDESGLPPAWISKAELTDHEIPRLESLLCEAGFPRRVPCVVANKGPLDGGRFYGALDVRLLGRSASWSFLSEGAGFSGADAEPIQALLQLLGELAEAGGRPAFHAVVSRLVRRRASGAVGLSERRPEKLRRWSRPASRPAGQRAGDPWAEQSK